MTRRPSAPISLLTLEALDRGVFGRWVRRVILVTSGGYAVVPNGGRVRLMSAPGTGTAMLVPWLLVPDPARCA